jgi:hypothetical protein
MGCANSKAIMPTDLRNPALQIPVSELRIKIPTDNKKTQTETRRQRRQRCRRGAGVKFDGSLPTFNAVLY